MFVRDTTILHAAAVLCLLMVARTLSSVCVCMCVRVRACVCVRARPPRLDWIGQLRAAPLLFGCRCGPCSNRLLSPAARGVL
jgi:hypothetical protein